MKKNISLPLRTSCSPGHHAWSTLPAGYILVHAFALDNAGREGCFLSQFPAETALEKRDIISTSLINLNDRSHRETITYAEIIFVLDVPAANILKTSANDDCTPDGNFYTGEGLASRAALARYFNTGDYRSVKGLHNYYPLLTPEQLIHRQNNEAKAIYNEVVIVAKEGVALRMDGCVTGKISVRELILLPDDDQFAGGKITDEVLNLAWERVKSLNRDKPCRILPRTNSRPEFRF